MTEAEKIAARAKIFAALGLGPNGMCKTATFPTLRNIEARTDDATRAILSKSELAACARHEVSPSTFLIARGAAKPPIDRGRTETTDAPRYQGSADDSGDDDPMLAAALESLAKYRAGGNRDDLFAAQAAIARMLKQSR